ncbi:hypothetical protein DQ384_26140 [Sphaerisporangium album]|uniref:MerR family transcriptional regulator n=1 Tax=Sphaerisporangium album TaxID=509200 RepID=A0A367FBF6_9ACTN|nr:hypothetical protein [Sphaerisporangium album]RCG27202.1 hypothetical protein DQ384_26140 [Sphaerisporangium album]
MTPSYRQIDHWIRRGWLRPIDNGGTGHPREWPVIESRVRDLMGRLVDAGFTPAAAADAARMHVTLGGSVLLADGLVLLIDGQGET